MIELVGLLIYPACGLIAALGVGFLSHGRDAEDGELYWQFVAFFVMSMLVSVGLLRTEWLQRKLDPQVDAALNLTAHPIMVELATTTAPEAEAIRSEIAGRVAKGVDVTTAIAMARPSMARLGNRELGWADAATQVQWATLEVATLRELRERDIGLCAAVAGSQIEPAGLSAVGSGLSPGNQAQFETAFLALMKSRMAGMSNQRPEPSEQLGFEEVQRRYSELREQLEQRHGEAVINYLSRGRFDNREAPVEDDRRVCDYRIDQLSLYLEEPPAMASRLIDAAMR